jgi:TatA/E family protein of Tat protein translocase
MGIENPVHLLFIAAVALVVLGPKRLTGLARALGHGIREFREALGDGAGSRPEASELTRAAPQDGTEPGGGADSAGAAESRAAGGHR